MSGKIGGAGKSGRPMFDLLVWFASNIRVSDCQDGNPGLNMSRFSHSFHFLSDLFDLFS